MKFFYGFLLLIAFGLSGFSLHTVNQSPNGLRPVSDSLPKGWTEIKFDSLDMVNRMVYADTANFMHQKLYPCARCMLRPEVADALIQAGKLAKKQDLKLVIFDCYRPYALQLKMYEIVSNPKYVAKPGIGSNHNRGAAVDLSLIDKEGNLLDMGSNFDDFSEVSHYAHKGLKQNAAKNRKLLRDIMQQSGFTPYENEWWHFDYKKKDYDISVYIWDCEEPAQH
ncbi:M15 family metallopeptidase [Flavobacterium rhizosphaerae]|uniref:D-alanyl-D-alanine dipeptidase n=1 Tax=Flavobacterium rhizosphaerae TaxID=3163298 RepID=A0ABW8YVY9_9FLAO